jgi:uncharacterized membrane-anchored protein
MAVEGREGGIYASMGVIGGLDTVGVIVGCIKAMESVAKRLWRAGYSVQDTYLKLIQCCFGKELLQGGAAPLGGGLLCSLSGVVALFVKILVYVVLDVGVILQGFVKVGLAGAVGFGVLVTEYGDETEISLAVRLGWVVLIVLAFVEGEGGEYP